MQVCDYCDIVHVEKKCPLCVANDRIKELENEVENISYELKERSS